MVSFLKTLDISEKAGKHERIVRRQKQKQSYWMKRIRKSTYCLKIAQPAKMASSIQAPTQLAAVFAGKGKIGLTVSKYFFELMEKNGIPTHYLDADIEKGVMKVRQLTVPNLEFVLRYFTAGSMCRRFTLPEGLPFDPPYLEVTLKDDEQGDPLITDRLCQMKGILKPGQYDEALDILTKVGAVLRDALAEMNLTLIDFKIEIGYDNDGKNVRRG
jgi:phosphoribosylaminoimidazole-succinocarboxamide synthase